jgi:hypothetical protein
MSLPLIYIQVASRAVDVEVVVNDIPLFGHSDGGGNFEMTEGVNRWLTVGLNRVRVFVRWPRDVPYAPGQASARVSVFIANPNLEFPTSGRDLVVLQWPESGRAEGYPAVAEGTFTLAEFPALRLWTVAERVRALTDLDRDQILTRIEELRAAILRGDSDAAYLQQSAKVEDTALAEGKTPAQLEASMRKQLQWLAGRPGLIARPDVPADIVLRLVAEGRLVQATLSDGSPTIQFVERDRDRVIALEPMFARIQGEWRILR